LDTDREVTENVRNCLRGSAAGLRNGLPPVLTVSVEVGETITGALQKELKMDPKAEASSPWNEIWDSLQTSASSERIPPVPTMAFYMVIGGLLTLYIRFLYRRCNSSFSGSDSVARVFPLLTMVTIGVISVAKTSPSLALGLIGTLSIIRFRVAIKDPEELVYLFLCIGIGLALGAEQPLFAVATVVVVSVFVLGIHFTTRTRHRQSLLLTITGDSKSDFNDGESGVLAVVNELVDHYTLQRLDLEQDRGQMRIAIGRNGDTDTSELIASLRERLPECEFSYVNLESTL